MNRVADKPIGKTAAVSAAAAAQPALPGAAWYAKLGLLAASVLLLSLAFAPVNQFYLAWIGLVPWLLAVVATSSRKAAFAWGFAGAWAFFLTNMWWLWFVSPPGLFALTLYLSIFWGLSAVVIRMLMRHRPGAEPSAAHGIAAVLLVPAAWVALEWMRGNVSFLGKQGLPWLYLGQTQSPMLVMCQVADFASVLGVSFWLVMINTLVALLILHRRNLRRLVPAVATVAALLLATAGYGAFRLSQDALRPGPTVLVVQSNYKQSNTGEKGAPTAEIVEFHLTTTRRALDEARRQGRQVDLVVWSETMMPPINRSARETARDTRAGQLWQTTYEALAELAAEYRVPLLAGGIYFDGWEEHEGALVPTDRRNTAYFIDQTGTLAEEHYDKVHLVPFGEYIPFKETIPPLYALFVKLGPNYYEEYVLTRGTDFTVFRVDSGDDAAPVRFVVPICFEDIVPSLVTRMLDAGDGTRRADLLVNITNDGWFRANQMPQHLQAALFRSIENRVPTARSVNTGISGFVDPLGRVGETVAAEVEGYALATVSLDSRVALYTRIGDAFPLVCLAVTGGAIVVIAMQARRQHGMRTEAE